MWLKKNPNKYNHAIILILLSPKIYIFQYFKFMHGVRVHVHCTVVHVLYNAHNNGQCCSIVAGFLLAEKKIRVYLLPSYIVHVMYVVRRSAHI